MNELLNREDQTRRILARVMRSDDAPHLFGPRTANHVDVGPGIEACRTALGRLQTEAETLEILGGGTAPKMDADSLHPLIWKAASERWEVGHYVDAVQRAATALNTEIQTRVGRYDLADSALMQQAFSLSQPAEGKPRLRWPGADDDLTVRAMRAGILNYSQGVFSAIRNPVTHSNEDLARQEALEQLAALSLLARWVDDCEVVTAPQS